MSEQQTTIEEKELASGVRLDVPFFGQYAEDVPAEWQKRVCGIASLRMALAYILGLSKVPGMAELINESEAIKGWTPYGLNHDAVVRLAHNHGVAAYREEYRSVSVDPASNSFSPSDHEEKMRSYGHNKLRAALTEGVIPIISVTVDGKKDTHLVPLIGFSGDGWYYHDPAEHNATPGAGIFMSEEEFERRFRELVIFIGPKT